MKNVLNCTGHELKIPDIVSSEGVFLFDGKGKRYMDLESGVWCAALGHKHPQINATITQQIASIMHTGFCYSSEIVDKAAESLLALTNITDGKCVFLSSGSETIELLRQAAGYITGRQKTLTLHDAYLGSYTSVINRNKDWYGFNWDACTSCSKNETCDPYCEKIQKLPEGISEFIFEPGSASGYVRCPPIGLIQQLAAVTHKYRGVVIANEVTTGVGRTGKWFGYQHYDIKPDMIAIGKGIGNGYPVSAAVLSHDCVSDLQTSGFNYMQGHQNDPLGAAIVYETIRIIQDEGLIHRVEKNGKIFFAKLQSLVDGKILVGIRGRGFMFAIDFGSKVITGRIYDELIENGFIVCKRGTFLRIDPPLIISEEEFEEFVDRLATIIAAL